MVALTHGARCRCGSGGSRRAEHRPLQGTEGAAIRSGHPTAGQIGFFAEGKLKTVGLNGEAPFEVGEATPGLGGGGGAWNRDGPSCLSPWRGLC